MPDEERIRPNFTSFMSIPIFSTVTLCMELLIGSVIFFLIYKGYGKNIFHEKLAIFAICYEVFFNVGYMVYRVVSKPQVFGLSRQMKVLAAFHGALSLAMLAAVVVFFSLAIKNYRRGVNYFQSHRVATFVFISFWSVSILSGIYLYFVVYF